MTKIAIAALNAEGNPYSFGEVVVRLVDAGSGGAVDGGVIVAPRPVRLDESGEGEVDLTPTADVDPAGTCYAFTVVGVAPTVVRYLTVPAPNIVGEAEVPYPWNDPDLQVVFAEPPTFVPAPSTGTVGEVLTLVDDGDGKRYELRPATGGAADDSELDVTASAPMLKASTVSAFYEAGADFVGVSAKIKAVTSAVLPSLAVTEAGDTQDEINDNVSGGLRFAQASADLARTQVGAVAAGAGAPGANFTSPDPYLLVGAGATPGGYQDNCYRMPAVTATFDDGVDFVGDAVVLDDCGIDGYREVGTHGRLDIDYDRFEGALRVVGGLVSIFGEYGRVGDPEVATGEYAPGRIYSENAVPPVLARIGDRIKWRETIENDRGDGKGRVRLWLPTEGVPDETAHGVSWRIVQEIVLDTTTSVSVVSDYWYSGFGDGRFGVFEASWYEYGGGFSHRFHPDDLQPDDTLVDSNGNVATPLGDATVVPGPAGGGLELGETSTTAYRGDRGKTAYDHSQATGNPHGATASDVGAIAAALVDAKGDLIVATAADTLARLAVGANGSKLVANSGATPGVEWRADPYIVTCPGATPTLLAAVTNYAFAMRVQGSGTISKIGLQIGTSSGNVCVAVYSSTGTAYNAVPDARLATSGSVACPSSGWAEISLGGSVEVQTGDWFAIAFDNNTATMFGVAAPGSGLANHGLSRAQAAAFPLPSTFTPGNGDRQVRLWGIP